jgi:hypothetical protein
VNETAPDFFVVGYKPGGAARTSLDGDVEVKFTERRRRDDVSHVGIWPLETKKQLPPLDSVCGRGTGT